MIYKRESYLLKGINDLLKGNPIYNNIANSLAFLLRKNAVAVE